MAKEKVVVEIEGDTSNLNTAIEASEDAIKDLSASGQKAVGALDKVTGGLASSFVQTAKGVQTFIKGLNLTKVAIIGTGIGALVVALGAVVSYFTQTKRGAELLQRVTATLGAVFAKITDALSALGEIIVNAFTNPQEAIEGMRQGVENLFNWYKSYLNLIKNGVILTLLKLKEGFLNAAIATKEFFGADASGLKEELNNVRAEIDQTKRELENDADTFTAPFIAAANAVKDFAQEVADSASQVNELVAAQQRLKDAQRELGVETARLRRDIKEYNLVAEDTTRPIEERIAAAEAAGQIERELLAERMRQAEEAIRIQEQLNEQSESGEEDLQALADLQTEYYALQTESLEMQTTLQNKYNTLVAEAVRLRQEEITAIETLGMKTTAFQQASVEGQERTIFAANYAQNQITQAESDGLTERQRMNMHAAQGYADIMNERVKQVGDFTNKTLGVIDSLNTLFSKGEEKRARRSFQLRKALGITTAVMGTAQAIVDALAKDSVAPFSRYASAAAAAAAGAAQIAVIARQQFQESGGSSGGVTRPSLPSVALQDANRPELGAPQVAQAPQQGFRSYVLANDVRTEMQANQKVREQSLLVL